MINVGQITQYWDSGKIVKTGMSDAIDYDSRAHGFVVIGRGGWTGLVVLFMHSV